MRKGQVLSAVLLCSLVLPLSACTPAVTGTTSSSTTSGAQAPAPKAASLQLPEGFPADFPVYPGTITDSRKEGSGATTRYKVELTTKDPADAVWDFYRTKPAEKGWKPNSENDAGIGYFGESTDAAVDITSVDGGAKILIDIWVN